MTTEEDRKMAECADMEVADLKQVVTINPCLLCFSAPGRCGY